MYSIQYSTPDAVNIRGQLVPCRHCKHTEITSFQRSNEFWSSRVTPWRVHVFRGNGPLVVENKTQVHHQVAKSSCSHSILEHYVNSPRKLPASFVETTTGLLVQWQCRRSVVQAIGSELSLACTGGYRDLQSAYSRLKGLVQLPFPAL
jgi:hypothetical protein